MVLIILLIILIIFFKFLNNQIKFYKLKLAIKYNYPIKITNFLPKNIINKFNETNILKNIGHCKTEYLE